MMVALPLLVFAVGCDVPPADPPPVATNVATSVASVATAAGTVSASESPPVCKGDWKPSLLGKFKLSKYPGQDDVGPNGEKPMPMSKDYHFEVASYRMDGYPPLLVTGSYKVLKIDGPRMQVRFTDTIFDGNKRDDADKSVVFSDCGNSFVLDGMTYSRVP